MSGRRRSDRRKRRIRNRLNRLENETIGVWVACVKTTTVCAYFSPPSVCYLMVSIRSSHYFSQVILLKDKKHFISRRELPPILTMTLPVGSFSSAQRRKLVKAEACRTKDDKLGH